MGSSVEKSREAGAAPVSTVPLEILLLGPPAVRRAGAEVPLPRSRKCRALIAYLAHEGRPQRREHLCELLWELPDDPRGSLRWSLSKLRQVLGDALVADRETVAIDRNAATSDASALAAAVGGLGNMSTADLEALTARTRGGFCEGLDLPRCPEFEAWLSAAREDVRRRQLAVATELVARLGEEPERALPFARARAALDPLSEEARSALVALLAAAGRSEEAERQRELALAALGDAGIAAPASLARPVRAAPAATAALAAAAAEAGAPAAQRVRFVASADGTRIAWSAAGTGPPLVKTANWMGHLEYDLTSPFLRHWAAELGRGRTLLRYDARGNGLSDRSPPDLSLESFVDDVEAVAATLPDAPFDLIGISQGAPVAIALAARRPERVRRLVVFGGFAAGWHRSASEAAHARWNAMITLAGLGWGQDNPAFRQMFTSLFFPRAEPGQADWFNQLQRVSATPAEAQRLLRAIGDFDVTDLLGKVRAPTLVFHCRGDALVPFGSGRHLAAAIPDAEFVALESENHLPLEDEPAWSVFVARLRAFLSG